MSTISRNIRWLSEKATSHCYKRDPHLWVFGEWMGNRCCDNSLALANYVSDNHSHIKTVWVSKKTADLSQLSPAVTRVEMNTPEAMEVLKHAGVAVMNQGLVDFGVDGTFLCSGAVNVQLWHGAPWKKIALDACGSLTGIRGAYCRYIQRLNRADMYLALSDEFARIMQSAFYAPKKDIILAGYPRNAIFYDASRVQAAREKVIRLLGLDAQNTGDLKLIAYMPTFRDNTDHVFSFEDLADNKELNAILEKHNAIIVQKAHFVSYQRNSSANEVESHRIWALNDIMAQELLAAADMLITDYSSCFFDYLVLDRPIVHYIYDYQYYAGEDRGVYYKAEDVVCGDAPETVEQLLAALDANLGDPDLRKNLRKERFAKYMTYESADSCEIIYQQIQARLK